MQKLIHYYINPNGKSPFVEWLKKVKDPVIRTRIERRIDRMGLNNYGDYKSVGGGVYELRLAFGSGYRIYFAEQDETVTILLCAGDKASQSQDIQDAKKFWQELKRCKNA